MVMISNPKARYWFTLSQILLLLVGIFLIAYSVGLERTLDRVLGLIFGVLFTTISLTMEKIYNYLYLGHLDRVIKRINEKTKGWK